MLHDKFFEEYAKTGTPRPEEPTDELLEDPEKDTYTRAEVDEIVNSKVAAAVDEVKAELNTMYGKIQNSRPETPAEQN